MVYFKPQWQAEQAFRIIQRLPDNGSGLQYRIKSETDGREWITTEATLHEKAAATASSSSQT